MASATRAAIEAARQQLAAETPAGIEVGAGLLQAARLIAGSTQLRGVLADPGVAIERKAALLDRVLAGIPAQARSLVDALVASRWSAPGDLPLALEELGIRAVAAAGAAELPAELLGFAAVIASDQELELALGSSIGDPAAKRALVERLLAGKASQGAAVIAAELAGQLGGRRIGALLQRAAAFAADQHGSELARVVSAAPLSTAQLAQLEQALSAEQGRPVTVAVSLDPALIGGVRVHLGDHIIDGSVQARLRELKLQLAS